VAFKYRGKEHFRPFDRAYKGWWFECVVWWNNGIVGKTKKYLYFYGKTVMGNPNVLRALYEELMLITTYCPCQVSSLDKIWENVTVLSC
jgi:hypothetical protein